MALANVALTDTFDTWRVRTNQIIVALDQANTLTYGSISNTTTGFSKANSANLLAYNTSIGANNWANTVGSSANSYALVTTTAIANGYANVTGTRSNTYATLVGTSANNYLSSYANTVGAASNTYAALVGTSANNYMLSRDTIIGAASNTWANTVGTSSNSYSLTVLSYANTWANTVGARANLWANYVGASTNNYSNYVGVSSNGFTTVVGAAANTLSNSKLANTDGVTFAGSIYFTTNAGIYAGTGQGSIYIVNNLINSAYNYNGVGSLGINYTGYNNGTSHFRDLYVYDGKSNTVALFAGSDKSLYVYGDVQAYYSSDISLKENITTITDAIAKVNSIRGVEFDWTDDYLAKKGNLDGYFIRKRDIGVIAQELEKVLPEAVGVREDGIKAVKYERIVPLLIEAIKGLSSEIEELKKGR